MEQIVCKKRCGGEDAQRKVRERGTQKWTTTKKQVHLRDEYNASRKASPFHLFFFTWLRFFSKTNQFSFLERGNKM
jgi:hypothetical protein